MSCETELECSQITSEPANKAVALTTQLHFKEICSFYRSGFPSLFPMKDIVVNSPMGFAFKQFSPFFESFNKKIGQLLDNGFVNELNKKLPSDNIKGFDDIGPQVLSLDHLWLGFIACLIPLALAIIVFFVEISVHAAKKLFLK